MYFTMEQKLFLNYVSKKSNTYIIYGVDILYMMEYNNCIVNKVDNVKIDNTKTNTNKLNKNKG